MDTNKEIPLTINYHEYLKVFKELERIKEEQKSDRRDLVERYTNYENSQDSWRRQEYGYRESIKNLQAKIEKLEKRKWYHLF